MSRKLTLQGLNDFCNNVSVTNLSIDMIAVRDLEKLVKELNPEFKLEMDGGETNGWQVDFWYSFNCLDTKFEYSGSLHYGECKLTKQDEDIE